MLIRVEGQNLTLERGGREDEFRFRFSRDWDRFVKFAQFTQGGRTYNTMLADNTCRLPPEVRPGGYYLNVTGMTPDSRDRATTCYLQLRRGGEERPPMPPPDAPEGEGRDLYAELTRRMDEAIRRSAALTLDAGLDQENMAAQSRAAGDAVRRAREEAGKALKEEAERLEGEIGALRVSLEALRQEAGAGRSAGEAAQAALGEVTSGLERAEARLDALEALGTEGAISGLSGRLEQTASLAGEAASRLSRAEAWQEEAGRKLADAGQEARRAAEDAGRLREDFLALDKREARGRELAEEGLRRCGERVTQLERRVADLPGREDAEAVRGRVRRVEETLREQGGAIDVLNKTVLAVSVRLDGVKAGDGACGEGHGAARAHRAAGEAMDEAARALREADALRGRVRALEDELRRVRIALEGTVSQQQGSQNAGRILGISGDGRVTPVDRRLASQVQSDLGQTDSTQADYVRGKPFSLLDRYMAVEGLVLMGGPDLPYLLRVNERGEMTVSEFTP